MEEIQKQVVKISLKKMFTQKYFSISDIDKCLKITQIIPDKSIYNTMSALHCVEYSDMTEDVRNWLLQKVEEMFMGTGFDLSFLEPKNEIKTETIQTILIEEKPKKNVFLRLLG